jgi:DNA invertase Pin-like site-specific DNA recombinase
LERKNQTLKPLKNKDLILPKGCAKNNSMKIGYARASTEEQNLNLQIDALNAAGCEKIFTDSAVSGTTVDRDGLNQMLSSFGEGDTIIVWKLDRLGRSLGFLCAFIEKLGEQKVNFKSLTDSIDTSTSSGKMTFHVMGAMAQFERDLISERTVAGMAAAKKRGKHVGRPKALSDLQIDHSVDLLSGGTGYAEISEILKVSTNTIRRAVAKRKSKNS